MRTIDELTTVFDSPPPDPAAAAFGFDTIEQPLRAQFGNVTMKRHPARLRIPAPEDVSLTLTSDPPETAQASLNPSSSAAPSPAPSSEGMVFLRSRRLGYS